MGAPHMVPVEMDGVLRPDLDFRWVTTSVMSRYLGVSITTLWRHTADGRYPHGVRKVGTQHHYQPRILLGVSK